MTKKKPVPYWLFALLFILGALLPIINRKLSPSKASLMVKDNSGSTSIKFYDNTLVAVFSNGTAAAWDSIAPAQPLWQFTADSDRMVMLDDARAAAVTKAGRKSLIAYDIKAGKKLSETPVGWEDQELWLLQSPDRNTLGLARINPDKEGRTVYDLMTVNPDKLTPDLPVSIDVPTAEKRLIAFAVANDKKAVAAGSNNKKGFLVIVDLATGKMLLEKDYPDAAEFTSAAFTPDSKQVFLTNRNGYVYGLDAATGDKKFEFVVLKPGEKNPVTNETRSDGVTISADGRVVAAVVINVAHVWNVATGEHIFDCSPGHKLTGAIALSPDGSILATSDIRASGAVKLWQVKKN
jgi:WD40 repeat protein